MASENETVAETLCEIFKAYETWKRSEIAELPTQYLKEWHDRIEAAHRREVAKLRRLLKVAEDALEYAKGSITNDCSADCEHVQECAYAGGLCLCERRINAALAAIREKGNTYDT